MPSKSRTVSKSGRRQSLLAYTAVVLSVIAIVISAIGYVHPKIEYINQTKTVYVNGTSSSAPVNLTRYNISGSLITPATSLQGYPPITTVGTPGNTLYGLNAPLNASELAVINNASDSYFEKAGEMLLNRSLANSVGSTVKSVQPFIVNGKPSVIYLGSITCVFCGENRWAMALALGRFGNFSSLYTGYSSLGDSDVPTIYWAPSHYNISGIDLGSFYSSNYINFIPFESTDPITAGFDLQPISQMQQIVNQSGNNVYMKAFDYIVQINNFQGTPWTIWGTSQVGGADAVDFGNSTATAPQPFADWTHAQVFSLLRNPNSQFAWTEYAAADLYIAMTCASLNNTAGICQLPVISQIETAEGY